MPLYVAHIGAMRPIPNGIANDGGLVLIEAETEEDAEIVAMYIIDTQWPTSAGWLRPARVSVGLLSALLAARPWNKESCTKPIRRSIG